MKSKWIFLWTLCSILLVGCAEFDDGSEVAPITLYEKMGGDWSIMSLKMVDEFAKANKVKPDEENLSNLFHYEDFMIKFHLDDKNQPTSYEVLGDVPPLFPAGGYWKLNSEFQPTSSMPLKVLLFSDPEKTKKISELEVASVPNGFGEMELHLVRVSGGVPFITYVFKLNALR